MFAIILYHFTFNQNLYYNQFLFLLQIFIFSHLYEGFVYFQCYYKIISNKSVLSIL